MRQGQLVVRGINIPLPIHGEGLLRVLYADHDLRYATLLPPARVLLRVTGCLLLLTNECERTNRAVFLRIFNSPRDSPDKWEESGLVVVQLPVSRLRGENYIPGYFSAS